MNAFQGYLSSVGPEIPQTRQGEYAQANATEALGASLRRLGQGIDRVSSVVFDNEEDIDREGRINAIRGRAALDEYTRTFLADAPNLKHTDDNGLSRHHLIAEKWRSGYEYEENGRKVTRGGYEALKKNIVNGLPPTMQAEWLAEIESRDEPRWQQAVQERGRELREDYADHAFANMIATYGRSGAFPDSERLLKEARDIFGKDDKAWKEFEDKANEMIVWGVAEWDVDEAHKRINGVIPHAKQAAMHDAVDRWAEYQDQFKQYKTAEEVRKTQRGLIDLIDADDMKGAVSLWNTSRADLGPETNKQVETWIGNRYQQTETDHGKAVGLLGEAIEALSVDDHEFRMKLADARYGEKGYLSQQSYEEIRDVLGKEYPPHAVAGIRAAYQATKSNPGKFVTAPGIMGGWAGYAPIGGRERMRQMREFFSWFDAEVQKGAIPDTEQSIIAAKKIGATLGEIPNEEVVRKFGGVPKNADFDDDNLPGSLRDMIQKARAYGWTDDQIRDAAEWQDYIKGKAK